MLSSVAGTVSYKPLLCDQKNGLLVTEVNQHVISDVDMAEWRAAIEEYHEKHGEGELPEGAFGLAGSLDRGVSDWTVISSDKRGGFQRRRGGVRMPNYCELVVTETKKGTSSVCLHQHGWRMPHGLGERD